MTPSHPSHAAVRVSATERQSVLADAAADTMSELLAASRWVIVLMYGTQVLAVNVYDDLPDAVRALDQLRSELPDGYAAKLYPAKPLTAAEIDAKNDA